MIVVGSLEHFLEIGQALHEMAVAGAPVTSRALSRFIQGVREGHAKPQPAGKPGGPMTFTEKQAQWQAAERDKFLQGGSDAG